MMDSKDYEDIVAEINARRTKEDAIMFVYRMLDNELKHFCGDRDEKESQEIRMSMEVEKILNDLKAYLKCAYLSAGTTTKTPRSLNEASPCSECKISP